MKKMVVLFFILLSAFSCAKEELTEETALIIGEAIVVDEKIVFPIFLERSKIYARMEASEIMEPLQKGDRVWIEIAKINKSQQWSPTAKFLRIIRNRYKIITNVNFNKRGHQNPLFLFYKNNISVYNKSKKNKINKVNEN